MKIVMFYPSVVCGGEHGTGHFVRGVVRELLTRGHSVRLLEGAGCGPQGDAERAAMERLCPGLETGRFDSGDIDLWEAIHGADLVVVHEQVGPSLVRQIGDYRLRAQGYRLLLHAGTGGATPGEEWDLPGYDGVLNGGGVRHEPLSPLPVWWWPHAVDAALFDLRQRHGERDGDVIWVGHWAGDRREALLRELLVQPVADLGLTGCVCGGGYPARFRQLLEEAAIQHAGVVPLRRLPHLLGRYRVALHVERDAPADEPRAAAHGGVIPMRVMEAMASGLPVIVGGPHDEPRWAVESGLRAGEHYVHAADGEAMRDALAGLVREGDATRRMADAGREVIMDDHTCAVRVDGLLGICHDLGMLSPESRTGHSLVSVAGGSKR